MGGSGFRAVLAAGRPAICIAAAAWYGTGAQAAIIGTCTINVLSNGEMTASPAIDRLGSKEASGQAARVSVTANSLVCVVLGLIDCYSISAPAPAAFLAYPPGGDAGVSFSTSYRIGGGPDFPGSQATKVVNGTYTVSVDLAAERASGVFPAGAYQAQVTVRCE